MEVVLGQRAADALIARGVPLQARTAAARAAEAATGVFRPWSGPGGLREEFVALADSHSSLVKQVVIGRSVTGQEILAFNGAMVNVGTSARSGVW